MAESEGREPARDRDGKDRGMSNTWFFLEWRCQGCDWKTVKGARWFALREITAEGVPAPAPQPCASCGKALKIVLDRRRRWKSAGGRLRLA